MGSGSEVYESFLKDGVPSGVGRVFVDRSHSGRGSGYGRVGFGYGGQHVVPSRAIGHGLHRDAVFAVGSRRHRYGRRKAGVLPSGGTARIIGRPARRDYGRLVDVVRGDDAVDVEFGRRSGRADADVARRPLDHQSRGSSPVYFARYCEIVGIDSSDFAHLPRFRAVGSVPYIDTPSHSKPSVYLQLSIPSGIPVSNSDVSSGSANRRGSRIQIVEIVFHLRPKGDRQRSFRRYRRKSRIGRIAHRKDSERSEERYGREYRPGNAFASFHNLI